VARTSCFCNHFFFDLLAFFDFPFDFFALFRPVGDAVGYDVVGCELVGCNVVG